MSTLLAPYQNAMRLGQGFNSYTQQICVDNAVKVTDRKTGNTITDLAETGTVKNRSNSQIVTYNSRHVDKLSDVSDSMNISGSLAIKYGTIQGSGSGAFVDTNKFRESDMNFLLQVKVINQTQILEESYEYQKLANVSKEKFTEVFGDCFISGFLEGGEFNALISIKVLDKSKLRDIKAAASLALSVGGVGIEASGSVGIKSSEIAQHTETTVSVSWSGGGVLKRPEEVWNISTVTAAASKFADLVAQTPQRTSAILTRYTSLRSFVIDQKDLSPLNYDNAGVYTADLLDAYMDYKLHWKNINIMLDESALYIKNPEPVYLPADLTTDEKTDVTLYEPNAFSLTRARTFCRQQMIRIVTEVDVVAKDPTTACKDSKAPYQSPDIFRARLPVLRKIEPTTVPAAAVEEGKSLQNRRRSAFAALRLDGYKQTHLYYVDTAGNIRYSVCNIEAGTQAGVWKDGGIVEEAKNVAANTPIAAAATFGSGKKVGSQFSSPSLPWVCRHVRAC
ncbi:hypothetical protein BZA05DRAFT_204837 [Tricharina praecox]|uniref:uncharacterized protein n=1 Tax=Tricharina praecox TaxID=43433 RepID=UPI00221F296F|nr:uncharacterized protein BZA05DRAFT_204837 [Tricharina praecox]KAI5856606.1 hypothetical protein BZA05DRAFT_204837 [Tricharina praecox]